MKRNSLIILAAVGCLLFQSGCGLIGHTLNRTINLLATPIRAVTDAETDASGETVFNPLTQEVPARAEIKR